MEQLLPHLQIGYNKTTTHWRSVNFSLRAEALIESIPGGHGFVGDHGEVVWLQPRAKSWLAEFYPQKNKYQLELPDAIRQQLRRCQEQNIRDAEIVQESKEHLLKTRIVPSVFGGWIIYFQRKPKYVMQEFRPLPFFSKRVNQVLEWLMQGKRNSEIATILHLSERTVEKHVASILRYLSLENRSGVASRVLELWEKTPQNSRS